MQFAILNFLFGLDGSSSAAVATSQKLITDIEHLISRYDTTIGVCVREERASNTEYQQNLISEQLEEAKESKAAAIGVGRLSKLAFIYIPLNFVCALLGINLELFGTRSIPIWVIFVLVALLSTATTLPILPSIWQYIKEKTAHLRLAI